MWNMPTTSTHPQPLHSYPLNAEALLLNVAAAAALGAHRHGAAPLHCRRPPHRRSREPAARGRNGGSGLFLGITACRYAARQAGCGRPGKPQRQPLHT